MPNVDFVQVFLLFAVLVLSLTVHEAAHAWSADRLGDATARMLGRVSLNPAVHVDPIGTILFPLMSIVSGFPLLGWAKPVPVSPHRLGRTWKQKYMAIAAAGPASNLLIAIVCSIVLRLVTSVTVENAGAIGLLGTVLVRGIELNVLLAVFNMLPIPPLDGGNVLSGLLSGQAARMFDSLRSYGFLILYGLLLSGILWRLVGPPENLLLSWLL